MRYLFRLNSNEGEKVTELYKPLDKKRGTER